MTNPLTPTAIETTPETIEAICLLAGQMLSLRGTINNPENAELCRVLKHVRTAAETLKFFNSKPTCYIDVVEKGGR